MRLLAGASLLLFLAACTAAPAPKPPPDPTPPANSVTAVPIEAPPPPKTEKKPEPQVAAAPPARQAKIDDDPRQLFRLDGHRVAALLGPASFVRRDGTAEVWQYRADACVLDVYLYRESGALTVAHVDLRQRMKATLPPRRCFRNMLTAEN